MTTDHKETTWDILERMWVVSLALKSLGWEEKELVYTVGTSDGITVVVDDDDYAPVQIVAGPVDEKVADTVVSSAESFYEKLSAMADQDLIAIWKKHMGEALTETLRPSYCR